jgi:hypothetical protein
MFDPAGPLDPNCEQLMATLSSPQVHRTFAVVMFCFGKIMQGAKRMVRGKSPNHRFLLLAGQAGMRIAGTDWLGQAGRDATTHQWH